MPIFVTFVVFPIRVHLIRFLLVLSFFSVINLWSQEGESTYKLLWEVKKKGRKTSYIFGTLHANDKRLFQFPDSLYSIFVNAEAVAIETDLTQLYEDYDMRLDYYDYDLFMQQHKMIQPNNATQTVYGSEDGRPQFLDAFFQQTAFCAGKHFFPLESVNDQLKLSDIMEVYSKEVAMTSVLKTKTRLFEAYLNGDLPTLTNILKSQFTDAPIGYNLLIDKRNISMSKVLDSLFRKYSVFVAVGAGHLYGNEGILNLLEKKGYQVRTISATFNGSTRKDKTKLYSWNSYSILNDTLNFKLDLAGKPLIIKDEHAYHCVFQELGQGNTYELIVRNNANYLDDNRSQFISNKTVKVLEISDDNAVIIEGLVMHPTKGVQWKRIVQFDDFAYELVCYGGNKFMHSNRPHKFFHQFSLLNTSCD